MASLRDGDPPPSGYAGEMTEDEFLDAVRANPANVALIERLRGLGLPQCYLTAGCLFQAVWNLKSGHPADWGVKDYDVFYFDDSDLSWEAEDAVIRQVEQATRDLAVTVDVKNQARVHLWYRSRYGEDYPQLKTAQAGTRRYLVTCTCIAINVHSGEVFAPYGLDDMASGILRMNPLNAKEQLFQQKAASYRERWPWLTTID